MKRTVFLGILVGVLVLSLFSASKAEVGVTDNEIVVGSHVDLSGPISSWGIYMKTGMEMKARETNEAGGIHGRKIRVVVEDNGYDPKKAIMVTNKMISRDKVFAFLCNNGTPTALASKSIISSNKIPQMYPGAGAVKLFDPYDRYAFGGDTPYYDQARAVVKYFVEHKKYTKFGLMYQDDEYGETVKNGVEDQLAAYKLKLLGAESYKRGATEFSSQITKLKKVNPQAVILGTVMRETVGALKEAKEIGWKVDMGGMVTSQTKFVPELCGKAGFSADGYYTAALTPYIYPDSPMKSVREAWERHIKWFGKEPDMGITVGYRALHFFEEAARRAGRDLTREKFIDALETFRDVPDTVFGGAPVTYTSTNHQGGSSACIEQLKGGRFIKVSDFIDFRK